MQWRNIINEVGEYGSVLTVYDAVFDKLS